MKVQANGISIEVEDSAAGEPAADRPAVLLIMGLGMQLTAWPPAFVRALVQAGYRVVRLDNRDAGLSQHFDPLGAPNLMWESLKRRIGLRVRAPYTLHEMAGDAIGVLDALDIRQAHVIGASMGGMVAQRMALAAPGRVLSLTSIMSSSSARHLPGPRPEVVRALFSRPADRSEAAVVEHSVQFFKLIGSPAYPVDEHSLRAAVLASMRRSFHPVGVQRQMVAVLADGDRADELSGISVPTLVIHGRDDPLVPYVCGLDTARRIPSARLVGVAGMGHDLAPGVIEQVLEPVLRHLQASGVACEHA